MLSALIIQGIPIECINQAAITYHVPAKLILAILKTEGGKNGLAHKNKNGTEDLGAMQINTRWLPVLKHYGYSRSDMQYNPCTNVKIGTWILSQKMADSQSKHYWEAVADYHSTSIHENALYQKWVLKRYEALEKILDAS